MKNAALERTIVFVGKEKKIKKAGKISCKQLQTISKRDFFRHFDSHRITVHINCFLH